MTEDSAGVRYDEGGWISGPMVPPGSSPARELLHSVRRALDVPEGSAALAGRVQAVRESLQRILADPDTWADDLMSEAAILRQAASDIPA